MNNPSAPINPQAKRPVIGCLLLLGVAIVFSGLFCGDTEEDMDRRAYIVSRRIVERYLKAPATAHFPYSGEEGVYLTHSGDTYYVDAYVDAENSFGATLRSPYNCTLRYVGPGDFDFEVEEFTFDGTPVISGAPTIPETASSSSEESDPEQAVTPESVDPPMPDLSVPDPPPPIDTDRSVMQVNCTSCNGTGYCPHCGGSGCRDCSSSGKCATCKGTGKVDKWQYIPQLP